MAEPPQPPQDNIQQMQTTDGQESSQTDPNSNSSRIITDISSNSINNVYNNDQENIYLTQTAQQQPIITPIQQNPNTEESFNPNTQYASFPPNSNFAIQAAAQLASQQAPPPQRKNKNIINPNNININMNQVLTSIAGFQGLIPYNTANAINGIAFGTKKAISRHKFSIDEDNLLRRLVNEHGTTNWRFIADNMVGRTARQCRDRWKNYLMPGIKNAPWTPEEDILLEEKFAVLGSQWSRIAKFFPNRTDINVKNRWATRSGRVNKAQPIIDLHSGSVNDNGSDGAIKRSSPPPPEIMNSINNAIDSIRRQTISSEIPSVQNNLSIIGVDENNNNDNNNDNDNKQINEDDKGSVDEDPQNDGGGDSLK